MHKARIADLALFGGPKLIAGPRPAHAPQAAQVYLDLLRVPYEARYMTNDGPLLLRLEAGLRDYHQVRNCVALAGAGLALSMLMQLFAQERKGEVIMPAFSSGALPHFAHWAGQTPRYGDVDPVTHGLDPVAAETCIGDATTSIVAVCNSNSPGALAQLGELGRRRGVPVILDCAGAIGSTYRGKRLGGFATAEVYSLGADSLLFGFAGGYVTTDDDDVAELLRWQRNFALPALRPPCADGRDRVYGLNAKLNELHAAMALASLQRLEAVIADNRACYEAYRQALAPIEGLSLLPYRDADTERRNFQRVVIELGDAWPMTRDRTLALLKAEGVALGAYCNPPLQESAPKLPVTQKLAQRFIELPGGAAVSPEQIAGIAALLHFIRDNHAAAAARMRS